MSTTSRSDGSLKHVATLMKMVAALAVTKQCPSGNYLSSRQSRIEKLVSSDTITSVN